MALRLAVAGVKVIGHGVWVAELTPAEVRRFGDGKSSVGAKSVLGVTQPDFSREALTLSLDPDHASVLNIGTTNEALIIDLGIIDERQAHSGEGITAGGDRWREANPTGKGDQAFLAECRRHLDERLVGLAERLLSAVRERYPGNLHEGLARKWVHQPGNFVALTIQNRDQSFAVHVKGRPMDFSAPFLDIKADRGSYSRFKLKHENQLKDTIRVVLASAQRSEGY
jgi:hypothetical protein